MKVERSKKIHSGKETADWARGGRRGRPGGDKEDQRASLGRSWRLGFKPDGYTRKKWDAKEEGPCFIWFRDVSRILLTSQGPSGDFREALDRGWGRAFGSCDGIRGLVQ